jgi:hypothetical protein
MDDANAGMVIGVNDGVGSGVGGDRVLLRCNMGDQEQKIET